MDPLALVRNFTSKAAEVYGMCCFIEHVSARQYIYVVPAITTLLPLPAPSKDRHYHLPIYELACFSMIRNVSVETCLLRIVDVFPRQSRKPIHWRKRLHLPADIPYATTQ